MNLLPTVVGGHPAREFRTVATEQQASLTEREEYNYFRDYDASVGRYIQSDPIGLRGGLSTYGYVRAKPLRHADRRGLFGEWFDPSGPPSGYTDVPASKPDTFVGGEGHFFVGGGLSSLTCTDQCGRSQTFRYVKVCGGGAIGAGASAGAVLGVSGKNCRSDTYKGWFYEGGYSLGPLSAGVDVGYNNDGPGGLPGSLSNVVEGGVGLGFGAMAKSTWCYYIPLQ